MHHEHTDMDYCGRSLKTDAWKYHGENNNGYRDSCKGEWVGLESCVLIIYRPAMVFT